jgi:hypothetical protein
MELQLDDVEIHKHAAALPTAVDEDQPGHIGASQGPCRHRREDARQGFLEKRPLAEG